MSTDNIEQQIQEKGLTAPRITPNQVENNIANEFYFTAEQGAFGAACHSADSETAVSNVVFHNPPALGLLTFCVLVLRNGYTVSGESACASPENFDAEIGRQIARKDAVSKVWALMGYELKSCLANEKVPA